MTTQNESLFSVKLITNSDGKIQPELFVCDKVEKLNVEALNNVVSIFKELKTKLVLAKYKVVENEVTSEIKNMSGWTQITVRGTSFEDVKAKYNELSSQYPITK